MSTTPAPDATASLRGCLPNLMRQKDDNTTSIVSRRGARRRMKMEIFETFGVSSATSNSSAPPVTSVPVGLRARHVCDSDTPCSRFQTIHRCTGLVSDRWTTEAGWCSQDIRHNPSPISQSLAVVGGNCGGLDE